MPLYGGGSGDRASFCWGGGGEGDLSSYLNSLSSAAVRFHHAKASWNVSMKRALQTAQYACLQAECEKK